MGMLLHRRYGYVLIAILIVVLIAYQMHNAPAEFNEEFITVLAANEDNPTQTFAENDLVNLTNFKYILKSHVCETVEDLLGKLLRMHLHSNLVL